MSEFHVLDARDLVERMRPLTRLLLMLFGRRLNRDALGAIISRAHERRVINSHQMHVLAAHFDVTQRGMFGIIRTLGWRGVLRRASRR